MLPFRSFINAHAGLRFLGVLFTGLGDLPMLMEEEHEGFNRDCKVNSYLFNVGYLTVICDLFENKLRLPVVYFVNLCMSCVTFFS